MAYCARARADAGVHGRWWREMAAAGVVATPADALPVLIPGPVAGPGISYSC